MWASYKRMAALFAPVHTTTSGPSPSGAPSTFSVTVARTTPLWKSTLPLPADVRHILRSATTPPLSPRECECYFYVCWYRRALLFFPTNLSQIRRVINLRRARLPCSAHLAINVAFIGTRRWDPSLRYSLLVLRRQSLCSWKDWLFEFIILPYISQSSLIKLNNRSGKFYCKNWVIISVFSKHKIQRVWNL